MAYQLSLVSKGVVSVAVVSLLVAYVCVMLATWGPPVRSAALALLNLVVRA